MIYFVQMKPFLFLFALFILGVAACKNSTQLFPQAEDGLDAGREFIDGCLKGDFLKAKFYLLADQRNTILLKASEAAYRTLDKEGRQQLRTASINIKELIEPCDSILVLMYSNSFDTSTLKAVIIKESNLWKVDYKQSFQ